jgi:hypothetical protein
MTIGPKVNPRPLILHVDSDTNIPYRLAESNEIVVDKITATEWSGLPPGNVTSINQLAGTGVFATTATNVTSFAGTGVFATVSYVSNNFIDNNQLDTQLAQYVGPYGSPSQGEVPYWDGGKWSGAVPGIDGDVLTLDAGLTPTWITPAGVISTPVAINLGGTNATGTPVSNGVIYYNGTRYATNSNLTFNGSVLAAPSLTLTNSLAVAQGGTGVTALGNLNLTSFGGTLSVAKGGTNSTTQQNNGVLHFNNATTAITSVTSFTFNGTTLAAPALALTTALPVNSGGTGRNTLTAGNFLIGNGTNQVSLQPTGNFLTTGTAAITYFPLTGQTLGVAQGGTGSTSFTSRGILFSDTNVTTSPNLKLGTTSKLLAVCGVAIPSKGLYIETGEENPTSPFNLKDIPDVDTATPTDNQVLAYNTTTSKWTPTTLAGASETWTTVFLQADETNGAASLQDSTLSASLISGETYSYEFNVIFESTLSDKFSFAVSSPAVTTHYWNIDYTVPTGGSFGNKRSLGGDGDLTKKDGTVDANGVGSVNIKGNITPSANGTLKFTFSLTSVVNGDTATIYAGSYLRYAQI